MGHSSMEKYQNILESWLNLFVKDLVSYTNKVNTLNYSKIKDEDFIDVNHHLLMKVIKNEMVFQPYALPYPFSGNILIEKPIVLLTYNPLFRKPKSWSEESDYPYIKEFTQVFKKGMKFSIYWDYCINRWSFYGKKALPQIYRNTIRFTKGFLDNKEIPVEKFLAIDLIPFYSVKSRFMESILDNEWLQDYFSILRQLLIEIDPQIIVTSNRIPSLFIKDWLKPKEQVQNVKLPKDNGKEFFTRKVVVTTYFDSLNIPVVLNFSGISYRSSNLSYNEIYRYGKKVSKLNFQVQ